MNEKVQQFLNNHRDHPRPSAIDPEPTSCPECHNRSLVSYRLAFKEPVQWEKEDGSLWESCLFECADCGFSTTGNRWIG